MREDRKDKRINEEDRIAIDLPGEAASAEGPAVKALTKDISLGGARVITDHLFEVGTSLRVTLYLSKSKQVVKVRGDVRWSRMIDADLYEMGIEFEHGIPASVLALINHLYGQGLDVPTSLRT